MLLLSNVDPGAFGSDSVRVVTSAHQVKGVLLLPIYLVCGRNYCESLSGRIVTSAHWVAERALVDTSAVPGVRYTLPSEQ